MEVSSLHDKDIKIKVIEDAHWTSEINTVKTSTNGKYKSVPSERKSTITKMKKIC